MSAELRGLGVSAGSAAGPAMRLGTPPALPAISDGMTRSGSPAANGIAPSVMNDRPSSQAASPAVRSAGVNSGLRTVEASAQAIGGVMPAAITAAMILVSPLARLARAKV